MAVQPIDALSFRALRVERRGLLLEVSIDHPESELNTVDETLHGELTALFAALRRESEARALLRERFGAGKAKGLKALLASAPLEGIELERDRDFGRDVDL